MQFSLRRESRAQSVSQPNLIKRGARAAVTCGLALTLGCGAVFGAGCTSVQVSNGSAAASAGSAQGSAQGSAATKAATRTVKDSDGNKVEIPAKVTKVVPTIGAFTQVTELLTAGNGKVVAAPMQQISDDFKAVFTDFNETNPDGRSSSSVEDIIASGAQVAYGPKSAFSDEQISQLEDAGVVFVNINKMSTADDLCNCIQTIGDILGEKESKRATEFVKYYKNSIAFAQKKSKKIAEADRATELTLSVEGGAYMVAPGSDISTPLVEAAGLTNLASDYTSDVKSNTGAMCQVSAEQIVAWNPSYIVAFSQQAADAIKSDAALAGVDAVANNHVLVCPKGLYLWCVRSGEGCLMPEWLGSVVYPDLYKGFDMTETLQKFYKDWYGSELSDADAELILSGATNAAAQSPRH